MLEQRLVTGALLATVVLAVVWLAPAWVVVSLFAVVALLAGGEWARLTGLSMPASVAYAGSLALALVGAAWLATTTSHRMSLLLAATVVWVIPLVQLVAYAWGWRQALPRLVALGLGLVLVTASWVSVATPVFHQLEAGYWLTALFVMVWGSDIGGYFVGGAIGRRPLAASLSPSKTWEGCAGGLALALAAVVALIAVVSAWGGFEAGAPWQQLFLVPVVVAAAVAGDLYESLIKRQAGAKDSGWIVAGHGGVLDRVDALLMAAPMYALLSMVTT